MKEAPLASANFMASLLKRQNQISICLDLKVAIVTGFWGPSLPRGDKQTGAIVYIGGPLIALSLVVGVIIIGFVSPSTFKQIVDMLGQIAHAVWPNLAMSI